MLLKALAVLRDFGKNALRSIYTFQAWLGNPWVGWSSMRHSNTSNLVRAQCRKSFAKISRSSVMKRILTSCSSRRASSSRQLGQHWMATWQVCQYTCFSHKMAEILWIFVVCTTSNVMFWWFVYHSLLDGLSSRSKAKMKKKWWKHVLVFSESITATVFPLWRVAIM